MTIHLNDIKNNQCRWIDNEASSLLYCGEPTLPGKSWCREHYARAFVPRHKPALKADPDARTNNDPLRLFRRR
jgi:hypothetical protein